MRRRGFTLVEMMVAVGVGTTVALAGLVLTADFQKFHHRHQSELDASQSLRRALELLGQDVRNAGVGVGYRPDGRFAGFLGGTFQVSGGATFQADDRPLVTIDGPLYVDDLGIRRALGQRRTVLFLEGGGGEICSGLQFDDDELVAVTSRNGRAGRTIRVVGSSPAACTRGQCAGGCAQLSWVEDPTYLSDESALNLTFTAGDLFQDYETVVWFIAVDEDGRGQLRRVGESTQDGCATADRSCGALVAEGVELLQYNLWAFDPDARRWAPLPMNQEIDTRQRLRMDIEVVARGRSDPGVGRSRPVRSQIRPDVCLPGPCGQEEPDGVPRVALRTSIEVKNAGRFQIR